MLLNISGKNMSKNKANVEKGESKKRKGNKKGLTQN